MFVEVFTRRRELEALNVPLLVLSGFSGFFGLAWSVAIARNVNASI